MLSTLLLLLAGLEVDPPEPEEDEGGGEEGEDEDKWLLLLAVGEVGLLLELGDRADPSGREKERIHVTCATCVCFVL